MAQVLGPRETQLKFRISGLMASALTTPGVVAIYRVKNLTHNLLICVIEQLFSGH